MRLSDCRCLMLVCCVGIVMAISARGQVDQLPRHGMIGLQLGPADPDKPEDRQTNPVAVKSVIPGSVAEAAGFRLGDIVLSLDGEPVTSIDFVRRISRHIAGETVSVRVLRQGEQMNKAVVLKPRPLETSTAADVLYTSVTVEGTRRRVIVTRPKAPGPHPAVLLIGGLGCYSLDGALGDPKGYGPILAALVTRHFVTMRVEKSGEGDSEGPACTDLKATAELEAKGYVAGLRLLKTYDFVDAKSIFVFAHSLGPLIGSMVVVQESINGFVAAETIGRSWFEYELENVRRQGALAGNPPDQVDADVRAHADCAYHFFLMHETADEVSRRGTACAGMIRSYAGVPYPYMQQIADLSLGKQWKQADIPVLVMYGTSDPATSADEGRYLAEIINRVHPGRAEYVELAGMGHDFARYASQADFLNRRRSNQEHPFDSDLVRALLKWLDKHLHAGL